MQKYNKFRPCGHSIGIEYESLHNAAGYSAWRSRLYRLYNDHSHCPAHVKNVLICSWCSSSALIWKSQIAACEHCFILHVKMAVPHSKSISSLIRFASETIRFVFNSVWKITIHTPLDIPRVRPKEKALEAIARYRVVLQLLGPCSNNMQRQHVAWHRPWCNCCCTAKVVPSQISTVSQCWRDEKCKQWHYSYCCSMVHKRKVTENRWCLSVPNESIR